MTGSHIWWEVQMLPILVLPLSCCHGMRRVMVCHLTAQGWFSVVLINYNDHCRSVLRFYFSRWDMKSWYAPESQMSELYFTSGCWMEIDKRCWVEIISTQHQAVIARIENPLFRPLQKLWIRYPVGPRWAPCRPHKPCCQGTHLCMGILQYLQQRIPTPFSHH